MLLSLFYDGASINGDLRADSQRCELQQHSKLTAHCKNDNAAYFGHGLHYNEWSLLNHRDTAWLCVHLFVLPEICESCPVRRGHRWVCPVRDSSVAFGLSRVRQVELLRRRRSPRRPTSARPTRRRPPESNKTPLLLPIRSQCTIFKLLLMLYVKLWDTLVILNRLCRVNN